MGPPPLNTAALTGESLPRDVKAGDEIISGCINLTGVLKVQTTRPFGESTVSRILDLWRTPPPQVQIRGLHLQIRPGLHPGGLSGRPGPGPPAASGPGAGAGPSADWDTWIYRALTFLVISCPCALVISIPLSFFAGIGGASRAGVLVKGSNYLETLSQTRIVVFDKTGTLTQGVFEVSGIHHTELEKARLVEYAALAESASSHPISKSLQRAYGRQPDRSRVRDIQEISRQRRHRRGGRPTPWPPGTTRLMDRLGIPFIPCHSVGTIIHMAIDGRYAGHIVISDVVKPHSGPPSRP